MDTLQGEARQQLHTDRPSTHWLISLVYGTTLALAIRGEAFWLLVVALISIAYLIPVIGLISRKLGGLTVPHLDTTLLAISVHSTIMAYIVGWEYSEILLAAAFVVALYYGGRYIAFARSIYN